MRNFVSAKPAGLLLVAFLALGACKTSEERAEDYYTSGLELLESGDVDRAILEFRNVFQLAPTHLEARRELGRVYLEEKGDKTRSYRQYLRVVEQYPEDIEARLILTELSLGTSNWDEVDRHGLYLEGLAPDDPRVKAVALVRKYRDAAQRKDLVAMEGLVAELKNMLEGQPDNTILRAVKIDADLRDGKYDAALIDIDWMLERDASNQQLLRQRLNILLQLGDNDAIEAQLQDMIERFPDVASHKATLLRYYMSREDVDKAEEYLRTLAAADEKPEATMDLVRFLMRVRGTDVAREELVKITQTIANPVPFQQALSVLDFGEGKQSEAISALEALVQDATETSESLRDTKITLARMYLSTDNEVGGRALVAEVLAEDGTHVEALKMQAAWQIEADDTDSAIANLRNALDQSPEDAQAMTLMSQAYIRTGRRELAKDFLALAVEASGNAPAETIRYAKVLIGDERFLPAEDILVTALRLATQDVGLLTELGRLYVAMEDFNRAEHVARTLREFDTPEAIAASNRIEAQRIGRQQGTDDALKYLEDLATSSDGSLGASLTLIRAQLSTGNVESALSSARELSVANPDNVSITGLLANVEALAGNIETAETLYNSILDENPSISGTLWVQVARIKTRQGDPDAATQAIQKGLSFLPDNPELLWAQASFLERGGKIDEAIEIYERLYERDSSAVVAANNLASLLSTYRDDAESLERAWVVARRFKDVPVPELQDTYGWIAHRRGDTEEALSSLEAAAIGLPNDPLVQYHLAEIYFALSRNDDALAQYRKAVSIAGPADQRRQFKSAQEKIQTLQKQPAAD